jgi:serine/threonine protein kinase
MAGESGRLRAALADRYAIERELGAGGMATVYLAHDVKHHRHVALKVMRPELAPAAERFLREITIAANRDRRPDAGLRHAQRRRQRALRHCLSVRERHLGGDAELLEAAGTVAP